MRSKGEALLASVQYIAHTFGYETETLRGFGQTRTQRDVMQHCAGQVS